MTGTQIDVAQRTYYMRRHRSLPERRVTQCPGTCCSRRSTASSPYGWVGRLLPFVRGCLLSGVLVGQRFGVRVMLVPVVTPAKYLLVEREGQTVR